MVHTLPELPWAKDALAPHISKETIEFHYGKHHQGYVNKLNAAIENKPELKDASLVDIIKKNEAGGIFNCAAQTYNHTFYWNSMAPNAGGEPSGKIADLIKATYGSFESFKKEFANVAAGHFGSGWAWLAAKDGKLHIVGTHDAGCVLTDGYEPILTLDVWEHAYYIDYRNDRGAYINAWWNVVNWDFANKNVEGAKL